MSLRSPAIDILIVCSGNICRSPMAEGLLRHGLAEAGVAARVSSCGLLYDGREATGHGVEVMSDRGIDIAGHRSRKITDEMLDADLIVGMAREHVREAVMMRPEVIARSFTLKELVRRGEAAGGRPHGEPMDAWLSTLTEERRPRALLGASLIDDVADPIGQPLRAYARTADELEDLVARLIAVGWPETRA